MNCSAFEKRLMSPNSATMVATATSATPRDLDRLYHGCERPIRQPLLDLDGQPIASIRRGVDGSDVVLENDMVRILGEPQTGEPAAMHLRPGRTMVVVAVAEQEARQLLAGVPQAAHRGRPGC